MNTKIPKTLKVENLNKKKSKHGKKNWRKNIDVSELETKNNLLAQDKLQQKDVANLKDDELFVVDVAPNNRLKKNILLNKKTERKDKKKKMSIHEERFIKRKSEMLGKEVEKTENVEMKDLWEDEDQNLKASRGYPSSNFKFPKVAIPHPGQSYNPSKGDLSNLVNKLITHKKQHTAPEEEPSVEIKFDAFPSDSEDEVILPNTNNPPVDDTQRKTRKEKKSAIQKKLNRVKERELKTKKESRINLANEKGLKRITKERAAQEKVNEEENKKAQQKDDEKVKLLKLGIVEDPELLNDLPSSKPVPLRKLKTNTSIISERFENILKRNVVGEFANIHKKKKNRKLNKMKIRDGFNDDYGYSIEEEDKKLKIFE